MARIVDAVQQDLRYAVRLVHRRPSFALSVAATIGIGLGLLGSAFALVNAYLLRSIDLPEPRTLYSLGWDSANVRGERFSPADLDDLRKLPGAKEVAGGREVTEMGTSTPISGLLGSRAHFRRSSSRHSQRTSFRSTPS